MVLLSVVLILIASAVVQKQSSYLVHRSLEKAILYQGQAYIKAIQSYYNSGNQKQFPATLDVLVSDSRFLNKRHLRQKYQLFNGINWEPILNSKNKVVGVYALLDKKPLKKNQFPELFTHFENAETYHDWKFLFVPE